MPAEKIMKIGKYLGTYENQVNAKILIPSYKISIFAFMKIILE